VCLLPPPHARWLKFARFLRIVGLESYPELVRKKSCLGAEQRENRLLREQQLRKPVPFHPVAQDVTADAEQPGGMHLIVAREF
jgi:hypothetical protein